MPKTKEWAQPALGKIDKSAITKMKTGLLEIEHEVKDATPSKLSATEAYNRTELLSAVGTVATFREANLTNPSYVQTLKEDIALLTPKATPPKEADRIRTHYDALASRNPAIAKGLTEISALIFQKEEKLGVAR